MATKVGNEEKQERDPSGAAPNGGPGRLASESEHDDGTVDPNDSGGKPVPTIDPGLDPAKIPPPNTGARP